MSVRVLLILIAAAITSHAQAGAERAHLGKTNATLAEAGECDR